MDHAVLELLVSVFNGEEPVDCRDSPAQHLHGVESVEEHLQSETSGIVPA